MRWLLGILASSILLGCIGNSEKSEESPDESNQNIPSTPKLFTELDSIVFNQLDYAYMRNKGNVLENPNDSAVRFSERGKRMLTQDTNQFFFDSVYYTEDDPVVTLFVRTKFIPKGWDAFVDRKNDIGCKIVRDADAPEQQDWLIESALGDSTFLLCNEKIRFFQNVYRLQPIYYVNKGFSFDPAGPIGSYDGGKIRIYYWR